MSDLFGPAGRRFLQGVRLRPIPQARLEANLRLIDLLVPEIGQADAELRELFRADPRITRLTSIPGIAGPSDLRPKRLMVRRRAAIGGAGRVVGCVLLGRSLNVTPRSAIRIRASAPPKRAWKCGGAWSTW
jgi:hypothetical protein